MSVAYRKEGLDLDGNAVGQAAHADGDAGVPARVAEHREEDLGGAVDHLGMIDELRRRVDESAYPDALHHPIEIAVERGAQVRKQVERAKPRRLPGLIDVDLTSHFADESALAVPLAELSCEEKKLAEANEWHVIGPRRAGSGQLDPLLAEALLDDPGGRCPRVEADGHHPDRIARFSGNDVASAAVGEN